MRSIALIFTVVMMLAGSPALAQMHCSPSVLSDVRVVEETPGFSIDVKYPVLCAPNARRAVRDRAMKFLTEFKLIFPGHDLKDFPHKYEAGTEYDVWSTGAGRLVSVKLNMFAYTGGAHPNHWPVTMVFDMTDGTTLELNDVFADTEIALAKLSPVVRQTLADSIGSMMVPEMLDSGTNPESVNYQNFIVNDEGIAFFFAPYQVAPYAAGEQVVTIPWSMADTYLRPEFRRMR